MPNVAWSIDMIFKITAVSLNNVATSVLSSMGIRVRILNKEYGYYRDALDSFTLKGKDGLERQSLEMETHRLKEPIRRLTIKPLWMQSLASGSCLPRMY